METNTPETDALFRKLEKLLPDQSPFYDMHEHAQKLERKLYEARAEIERLKDDMLAMTVFQD